ncbi:hypothetical protein [Novosphingobium mathurense]|uniref:hypothetical protein n=1 Tax=Novosphingobium mathurense TaxID=428990 RepID=UPI001115AF3A|nr:hypothetical protein [Novosphingobium mathurense]
MINAGWYNASQVLPEAAGHQDAIYTSTETELLSTQVEAVVEAMFDGISIAPGALCPIIDREIAAGRMKSAERLLTLNAAACALSSRQLAAGRMSANLNSSMH